MSINTNIPFQTLSKAALEQTLAQITLRNQESLAVLLIGDSGVGKTEFVHRLILETFGAGWDAFSGKSNTTPYPVAVQLQCNDDATPGAVLVAQIKAQQILAGDAFLFLNHLLTKGLISGLSGIPTDTDRRIEFLKRETLKLLAPKDLPRFRVHRLLGANLEDDTIVAFLVALLSKALELAEQEHLAASLDAAQADVLNKSTQFANPRKEAKLCRDKLLATFVREFLTDDENARLHKFTDMLLDRAEACLTRAGLTKMEQGNSTYYFAPNLSADAFAIAAKALTNTEKRGDFKDFPETAACVVENLKIVLPLAPSCQQELFSSGTAQRSIVIHDTVGLTNDGATAGKPQQFLSQALVETFYDVVVFMDKSSNQNTLLRNETIQAIAHSVRPCQLLAVFTHLDKTSLFDDDDEPDTDDLQEFVDELRKDFVLAAEDALDNRPTVVCPSNGVLVWGRNQNKKNDPRYAPYFDEDYQRGQISKLLARAADNRKGKIRIHNLDDGLEKSFLQLHHAAFQNNLSEKLRAVFRELIHREFYLFLHNVRNYHHWTLDALFNALHNGWSYRSNAYVFDNLESKFYLCATDSCFDALRPYICFDPRVNIPDPEARQYLRDEFFANLQTCLSDAVRAFFLASFRERFFGSQVDLQGQYSCQTCENGLRDIYLRHRFYPRKDMLDLIAAFEGHLTEENFPFLEVCIQQAIANARYQTYRRCIAYR